MQGFSVYDLTESQRSMLWQDAYKKHLSFKDLKATKNETRIIC
jgi:hypothetical protein